jgi:hypothetical protein
MPDVNVAVNVDGKTVFAHGANAAVDPIGCAITGLEAALAHFRALKEARYGVAFNALAQAQAEMQKASEGATTKGPSL